MIGEVTYDRASFKGMEQAGWDSSAASYDELLGSITRKAIGPLLDACGVLAGTRVLDLCCGPGYGAAAAAERGAQSVGMDFSPSMISLARRLHPSVTFVQGDAEAIDVGSDSFDAVVCAFGVNHLADPLKSIREVHRVLRPGGKYSFSMWCSPGKSKFHELVLETVRTYGTMDVALPPAPPPFRFSDPSVCMEELSSAGFSDPSVVEVPLAFRARLATDVLALTACAVRMQMMIDMQTAQARERIREALVLGAEEYRTGALVVIPMPALIASGTKE